MPAKFPHTINIFLGLWFWHQSCWKNVQQKEKENMNPKILIVDDGPSILNSFQLYLRDVPVDLVTSSSVDDAIRQFRAKPESYAGAFIDYMLLNEFGEQEALGHKMAKKLKKFNPSLYVVMMSGDDSREALRTWLSSGVEKFVYKPLKKELIYAFVDHALAIFQEKNPQSKNKVTDRHGLVSVSGHMRRAIQLVDKFAPSDETVLISGETGTGKELVAQALHKQSSRANRPFVALNCAAITESLFESEFFGHVRGAFTGAEANKLGKFREANGGTLFLDEIHHLSLAQQAKILRAIQEKTVMPVGDKREHKVDFRLICTCRPNLRERSINNKFLIDLFFRISSLNIEILPLRCRPDDIGPLINFFKSEIEDKLGTFKRFSSAALDHLREYRWPGNVRELQKTIRELYFVVDSSIVQHTDLPAHILHNTSAINITSSMTMADLDECQREQKRVLIKTVMQEVGNNKSKAAKLLGMKRSTFIWLVQDLRIGHLFKKEKSQMETCDGQLVT